MNTRSEYLALSPYQRRRVREFLELAKRTENLVRITSRDGVAILEAMSEDDAYYYDESQTFKHRLEYIDAFCL